MEHESRRCEGMVKDEPLLRCAASNPTRRRLLVAKVKPKPKAPVAIDFPVDDVPILILAMLPAKTLQKFRCVCKSWNSLIQEDHHFISLHQLHLNDNVKKRPPLLLTLFATFRNCYKGLESCVLNYWSSSSSSDTTTPYKMDFTRFQPKEDLPIDDLSDFKNPLYFLTNSCNGLLGVYSWHSFFIVNPTIRKLRPLPTTCVTPAWLAQAALGFDASTGVYKVVRIFDRERYTLESVGFGCEVCYLGGGDGSGSDDWKPIDDPPVQPSYESLPVVVDGAIIWASETIQTEDQEVVALSFDLREEKFSVILHPEVSSRPTANPKSHVFASEGRICVADQIPCPVPLPYTNVQHLNIWVLMEEEDHDKKKKKKNSNKWVKQYVVDLTYVSERFGPFGKAQPLTTDHNGRIVISCGRGRILYYDPRTGSFDKHKQNATHVGGGVLRISSVASVPGEIEEAVTQSTKLEHIAVSLSLSPSS